MYVKLFLNINITGAKKNEVSHWHLRNSSPPSLKTKVFYLISLFDFDTSTWCMNSDLILQVIQLFRVTALDPLGCLRDTLLSIVQNGAQRWPSDVQRRNEAGALQTVDQSAPHPLPLLLLLEGSELEKVISYTLPVCFIYGTAHRDTRIRL